MASSQNEYKRSEFSDILTNDHVDVFTFNNISSCAVVLFALHHGHGQFLLFVRSSVGFSCAHIAIGQQAEKCVQLAPVTSWCFECHNLYLVDKLTSWQVYKDLVPHGSCQLVSCQLVNWILNSSRKDSAKICDYPWNRWLFRRYWIFLQRKRQKDLIILDKRKIKQI